MLDQVNLDEDPAFTDLGSRYLPGLGFTQERDRMNLQQVGGFMQGEGFHDYFQEQAQPAWPS